MSDSRIHSAGKGDKPRPIDRKKYNQNFDQIKWGNSKKVVDVSIKKK